MSDNEKLIVNSAVLYDGRKTLTCTQALQLSQEHALSLKEIGETCNRHSIKIISCQLGCFK